MGNMVAAASKLGNTTMNILDKRRDIKEQKHNLYANYVNTTQKRKNLLEQQLASRRAKLGSAGIASSSSSLAVQNRDVENTYSDIQYETDKYKRASKKLDRNYRSDMLHNMFDTASSKIIK